MNSQGNSPGEREQGRTPNAVRSGLAFVPDFPGAGNSGADEPLADGVICDTVTRTNKKFIKPTTTCFFQPGQTQPSATIEQVLECVEGVDAVHLRLTFDPAFVDNSFGENAIGWDQRGGGPGGPGMKAPAPGPMPVAPMPPPPAAGKGPGMMGPGMMGPGMMGAKGPGMMGPGMGRHPFMALVGSDHAEFVVTNEDDELVSQFKLDYISRDDDAVSGYASLGVLGGDGKMITGDAADVVEWQTSIELNLNERGYDEYVIDSPATDDDYAINDDAPNWDYRVVYEAWIADEAFGDSGFGGAKIEHVHASPSKAPKDTIEVTPGDCPCQQDGGCGVPPLDCVLTPNDPACGVPPLDCERTPDAAGCELI